MGTVKELGSARGHPCPWRHGGDDIRLVATAAADTQESHSRWAELVHGHEQISASGSLPVTLNGWGPLQAIILSRYRHPPWMANAIMVNSHKTTRFYGGRC